MKTIIFAGGLGTRLMEETRLKPKPMVEIGGFPILWHIMKIYQHHGFNDFIICLGYRGWEIKEYFLNYHLRNVDFSVDTATGEIVIHKKTDDKLKITFVETGLHTNTAGRLFKVKDYIEEDTFMLTYGDGVADINLKSLLSFHHQHKKLATLTAINYPDRFGKLKINNANGVIEEFSEKPKSLENWVNAGFFVLNREVFKYLNNNHEFIQWEKGPLIELSESNNLVAFKHNGFWKPMDALRDKNELEELWNSGNAPWKIWK